MWWIPGEEEGETGVTARRVDKLEREESRGTNAFREGRERERG